MERIVELLACATLAGIAVTFALVALSIIGKVVS